MCIKWMVAAFRNNEETGRKNIYIVEPVEVYNQRGGRLKGRTRQTMTDASRKKAARGLDIA